MLKEKLSKYHIILASKSPRRQFLIKELGLDFETRTKETDESFPKKLKGKQIALYLCKKKAEAFKDELHPNDLLITADTIVWINNKALNKTELQQALGLQAAADTPLVAIISRITYQKGSDVVLGVMHDLVREGVQFALLGSGDKDQERDHRQQPANAIVNLVMERHHVQ